MNTITNPGSGPNFKAPIRVGTSAKFMCKNVGKNGNGTLIKYKINEIAVSIAIYVIFESFNPELLILGFSISPRQSSKHFFHPDYTVGSGF